MESEAVLWENFQENYWRFGKCRFVVRHFCQLIRIHKDTRFMNRELYGLEETLSNYFNQLGEICIIFCWGSQQNLHEWLLIRCCVVVELFVLNLRAFKLYYRMLWIENWLNFHLNYEKMPSKHDWLYFNVVEHRIKQENVELIPNEFIE